MPRASGCPHGLGFCYLLPDSEGFGDTQPVADSNSELIAERVESNFRLNVSTPLQENRESLQDQVFHTKRLVGVVEFAGVLVFLLDDFAQFFASE